MKTQINLKCVDQTLTFESTPLTASGGIKANSLKFTFDSNWEGYGEYTAVFYKDKKSVYYSMLDDDNICIIPKEVLASEGIMYFGVFAVNGDSTKTSQILAIKVVPGAITENIQPSDPTPSIYEQILEKLQEIRDAESNFEIKITNQQNSFEDKITEQQSDYESKITQQQNTFEESQKAEQENFVTEIKQIQSDFESAQEQRQQDYEDKITRTEADFEAEVLKKIAEFDVTSLEGRLASLEYQINHNDYYSMLVDDDGAYFTDDDGNYLLADWKYKEE